jgi:hypothetical protein
MDQSGFHNENSLAVYQGLVYYLLWLHSKYDKVGTWRLAGYWDPVVSWTTRSRLVQRAGPVQWSTWNWIWYRQTGFRTRLSRTAKRALGGAALGLKAALGGCIFLFALWAKTKASKRI